MKADLPAEGARLRVGIGIATVGRALILRDILKDMAQQTQQPDRIMVCHTAASDIAGILPEDMPPGVEARFMVSAAGLPRQRNVILDTSAGLDIVLFIDDDFVMAPRFVEAVLRCFHDNPHIVGVTGRVIHDDARGPGLGVVAGREKIAADAATQGSALDTAWRAAPHCYGCNMAYRMDVVRAKMLRFDERLPLYGWSEDIDFAHRIARHGMLAKLEGARGVHLGVKQARTAGRRLGYSQVANPLYLLGKGSYSAGRAGRSIARNIAANSLRALWPEPYIDRRGRLAGNALALVDMVRGRMKPERILEL
jgi:hypothetical protein